jgi:hypothetical protein
MHGPTYRLQVMFREPDGRTDWPPVYERDVMEADLHNAISHAMTSMRHVEEWKSGNLVWLKDPHGMIVWLYTLQDRNQNPKQP